VICKSPFIKGLQANEQMENCPTAWQHWHVDQLAMYNPICVKA